MTFPAQQLSWKLQEGATSPPGTEAQIGPMGPRDLQLRPGAPPWAFKQETPKGLSKTLALTDCSEATGSPLLHEALVWASVSGSPDVTWNKACPPVDSLCPLALKPQNQRAQENSFLLFHKQTTRTPDGTHVGGVQGNQQGPRLGLWRCREMQRLSLGSRKPDALNL